MFAGKWEAHCTVVERRALPLNCVVTGFACLRESARGVIRIAGPLKVREVTSRTRRPQSCKLAAYVAGGACGRGVLACERKPRSRVIKLGALPLRGGVAK